MPTYKVIIMRFRGESSTFKRGLTLEQAQAICSDPETSSSTSSDPTKYGESPWFFGFTEEK